MEPIKISVTLSAYNHEKFISKAIESLFHQTYPIDELIINDDASTDRTFAVIEETVARCQKQPHQIRHCRIYRATNNLGLIGVFDQFHQRAHNTFLTGLAGDDFAHPRRFERLVECYLKAGRPKYFLAHHSVILVDRKTGQEGEIWRPPVKTSSPDPLALVDQFALHIGATMAWTKPLYTDFGPIKYQTYEDLVLGFRAALAGQYHYLDEPLLYYRTGGLSWKTASSETNERHWRHTLLQRACDALMAERLDVVQKITKTYNTLDRK